MASEDIVIIDPVSAQPYTAGSLSLEPMGGTEATVIRVAKELSKKQTVTIAQSARIDTITDEYGIVYVPYIYGSLKNPVKHPDNVIVIRSNKVLPRVRKQYPHSSLFLWMHCFPGKHHKRLNNVALQTGATIITVSDTHKKAVIDFIRKYQNHGNYDRRLAEVIRIYNPIDDDLNPDGTQVNPNKLVYFSSPHKGLPQVLNTFSYLRKTNPELCLYVANPGYMWLKSQSNIDGVVYLGALPHSNVIKHVREALCVFYPQSNFKETFGLVFAEANAVGTPVLAHDIGSTSEILGQNEQLVNAERKEEVKSIVERWRTFNRPRVSISNEFRSSHISRQWEEILLRQKISA